MEELKISQRTHILPISAALDSLAPTEFVRKFPASKPALLSAGSQAIKAPPISVGMIKAMIAMPLPLYLPAHHVPNATETKATAQPGRLKSKVV